MNLNVEVFDYLGIRILYIIDINYYFHIKNTNKINLGNHLINDEQLKCLIKEECPDEFSVFMNTPIEERLQKRTIDKSEVDNILRTSQYTLCLHPSRVCNLDCRYCFKESDYLESKQLSEQVAIDAINFLINEYGSNASKYIIDLSGSGEPLLQLDLVKKIVSYCNKKRSEIGRNIEVMFSTNFTRLTPETAEYIDNESSIIIGTSIDGDQVTNDNNRIYMDGKGTYEDIVKGLHMFKNKKIGLAVTITPLNQNVDEIYDHLYHIKNVDCVSMRFLRSYDGSDYDFENFNVPYLVSRYEKLCDNILMELEKGNFDYLQKLIQGADYFGGLITGRIYKGSYKAYMCDAGKNRIAVNSSGNVYACSVMNGNEDFAIGNIYTGIDESKQEKFLVFSTEISSICNSCIIKDTNCGGECHVNSYYKHGDMYSPISKMCKIKIELNKLCMAFISKIKYDYPEIFEKLVNYTLKVGQYDITDPAVWAVMLYLRQRGIEVEYSKIVENFNFTDNGVPPIEILNYLKKYKEDVDAYQIESASSMELLSFPAIILLNKSPNYTYRYAVILEKDEDCILFKTTGAEENTVYKVPVDRFLEEVSDIVIL